MRGKAELLECRSGGKPGREFLLEYQRSVLLTLEKRGLLTPEQLAECVRKLEKLDPPR